MACAPHKNPLQRSGTSQADRRLPGLSPEYVRIDERRYSDWIVFAAEFSKWLRFYDSASGASLQGWQAVRTGAAELSGTAKSASSSPISSDDVRQNRTDLQKTSPQR